LTQQTLDTPLSEESLHELVAEPANQRPKRAERSDHRPLVDVLVHEANEIARHPGHAWDWRSRARH
jgi:hypothetical protein